LRLTDIIRSAARSDPDWQDPFRMKAADVTQPFGVGMLDTLTQGSVSYAADGSLSFFQLFGSSYGKIYRSQSALRAVVDFLSRNIAQCHIKVRAADADGVVLPVPDDPVQQLLDHPQPGVPYTRFMRQIVADKAIYDVAAVWKIRENFDPEIRADGTILNTGTVRSLMRVPIPYISLTQSSLSAPLEFQVATGKRPVKVPPADMIWMPGYAPDSNVAGVPPLETLRQILAEEWAAGKDRENHWKHGVQGGVVFIQDPSAPGLDKDSAERFKAGWRSKYGGVTATSAREWPLLPPGITPKELAIDAASAEYLATRNLAREECCRAYGIQPQLLGITPANFASMDMYHQMLYQDTLAPWMVPIQEEFEEQLMREFHAVDSGYSLDFNINAKLQGSFLDQAKIGQQAVGGPWMTRNEFREKFQGLPPVEGGDDIIVPLNVVLGGGQQANPQDATNQFNAELLPDGVMRLTPRQEGTRQ
jgi:HK97 family phage portal protein